MCLLLKTMPAKSQELKRCINTGLDIDDSHPTLLLLKAEIQPNNALSLKYAKQALKEARSRKWSIKAISAFMQTLDPGALN